MHYQLSILLASMFTATSSAFPANTESQLQSREAKLNPSGNVKMTFSDTVVSIGTAPVSVIMSNFAKACATSGLCNTSPIEITGYQSWNQGYNSNDNPEITITLQPNGAYETWIHNGLLDGISAVIGKIANCSTVTYRTESSVAAHMPTTSHSVNQCTIPQFIGISFQDPKSGSAAPSFMEFNTAITADTDGFCSTFFGITSAVAGAVNGVAGGMFSLASIVCSSI